MEKVWEVVKGQRWAHDRHAEAKLREQEGREERQATGDKALETAPAGSNGSVDYRLSGASTAPGTAASTAAVETPGPRAEPGVMSRWAQQILYSGVLHATNSSDPRMLVSAAAEAQEETADHDSPDDLLLGKDLFFFPYGCPLASPLPRP